MTWIFSDENQRKAVREIEETKSDRAAAIVGAAFVERDLENAIEAHLVNPEPDIFKKLFKPTGPLGAFQTKADLGFLMGIYISDTHQDICDMASIRNKFAHSRTPIDFGSREVRILCEGFRLINRPDYPKVPGKGLPDELRAPPRLPDGASPRDRYVQTIKLLTIAFWAKSHDLVIDADGREKKAWREQPAS